MQELAGLADRLPRLQHLRGVCAYNTAEQAPNKKSCKALPSVKTS
jgi:hypothetical protein